MMALKGLGKAALLPLAWRCNGTAVASKNLQAAAIYGYRCCERKRL